MKNCFEIGDTVAFHPGYYIEEIIKERKITEEDFARELRVPEKNLQQIIRAERCLSVEVAQKLFKATGISVGCWLNVQAAYNKAMSYYGN